jgi:hypothetical protein
LRIRAADLRVTGDRSLQIFLANCARGSRPTPGSGGFLLLAN